MTKGVLGVELIGAFWIALHLMGCGSDLSSLSPSNIQDKISSALTFPSPSPSIVGTEDFVINQVTCTAGANPAKIQSVDQGIASGAIQILTALSATDLTMTINEPKCQMIDDFSLAPLSGNVNLAKLNTSTCSSTCSSCPGTKYIGQTVPANIDASSGITIELPNLGLLLQSSPLPPCSSGAELELSGVSSGS